MFEIRDIDLAGRLGRLYTPHGVVETPAFFPVIDIYRQEIDINLIKDLGFNQVITNAYLLYRRFGPDIGDVHSKLGFNGVVMTDSGAYQILHYGKDINVTQEEIINYQKKINSDIAVILDIPTGKTSYETAKRTVEITLQRAREALNLIDSDRLWVLPIQGGPYSDLVEYSSIESSKIDYKYHIYGIGSPTVFLEKYDYDIVLRNIIIIKKYIKKGKPVHLFGAGHPLLIPFAVALGVDTFDSASYALYARDLRVFTELGVERLERIHKLVCPCNIYNKNIFYKDELISYNKEKLIKILQTYNLCIIKKYIELTKEAIQEGKLWDLLRALSYHHPSLFDSFKIISSASPDYLSSVAPRIGGIVRGLRVYDKDDILNPKIIYYLNKIKKYNIECNNMKIIEFRPLPRDPDECEVSVDRCIVYYDRVLGIVPQELCGTFPTIHLHMPKRASISPSNDIVLEVVEHIVNKILNKFNFNYKLILEPESDNQRVVYKLIKSLINK